MKKALITGVTGQDGSYLAEHLLACGYHVTGVARRASTPNDSRIRHLYSNENFRVVQGDITDPFCVQRLLIQGYDEVYNLAAQSHVGTSFDQPGLTTDVVYKGVLNILEAVRSLPFEKPRVYQASSSEMFGTAYSSFYEFDGIRDDYDCRVTCHDEQKRGKCFQDESTPFLSCSPYGIAKTAAHLLCRMYRESYGLHVSCGILFNHESPRRGESFVTRKITKHVAAYHKLKKREKLKLGNLDAKRDWGHASDYVRAMHLMVSQAKPDDYVIATGETHSVRDFLYAAFDEVGVDIRGREKEFIEIDASLCRPFEVPLLKGDSSKAKAKLQWTPKVSFQELVEDMVWSDIEALRTERV